MNSQHVATLQAGVATFNAWRNDNPSLTPDLSGAQLDGSNLMGANLNGADLHEADLNGANLDEANLNEAAQETDHA